MTRTAAYVTLVITTALVAPGDLKTLLPKRNERGGGSNSVETLIIVGATAALALIVVGLVAVFVKSKAPSA